MTQDSYRVWYRLEQAYCGTIGYEYMHIPDRDKCNWIRDQIETQVPGKYGPSRKAVILDRLMWGTDFENFLAQKWTAAKRFGLEGCETLIPGTKVSPMVMRCTTASKTFLSFLVLRLLHPC